MEKLLLYIISLGFFTLVSAGVLQMVFERRQRFAQRIESLRVGSYLPEEPEEEKSSWKDRLLAPIGASMKQFLSKRTNAKRKDKLSSSLAQAGHPFHWSTGDFLLVECVLTAGLFLVTFVVFLSSGKLSTAFMVALVAACLGFIYPRLYLKDQKNKRLKQIDRSLPDFFDMVSVSLEAGMGLDGALLKVCKRMGGPLGEEFLQSIEEMKLGKSRREAFSDLRSRIPSELFQSVMSAMIQADQFGIGMTKVIRSQTKRIRERRRQRAREQAMKAPIKMLIPLALFIFPVIFIVILGPLIVKVATEFF